MLQCNELVIWHTWYWYNDWSENISKLLSSEWWGEQRLNTSKEGASCGMNTRARASMCGRIARQSRWMLKWWIVCLDIWYFAELPAKWPGGSRESVRVDQKYVDVWAHRQDQPRPSAEVRYVKELRDIRNFNRFIYQTSILWQNPFRQSSQFRTIDNQLLQWTTFISG